MQAMPVDKYFRTLEVYLGRNDKGHITARVMQWQNDSPVFGDNLLPDKNLSMIEARGMVYARLAHLAMDIEFMVDADLPDVLRSYDA